LSKSIDGKENDIKIVHSRLTDQVQEINKIKDKIFKVEETYNKLENFEDFKMNYEIKFNEFSNIIRSNLDNTTKAVELRLTGRLQSNEEQMERILSRVSSVETKLEIEASRLNKTESSNGNNYENISNLSGKLKNQQDIIDEMRRMIFSKLSKIDNSLKNGTIGTPNNRTTTPNKLRDNINISNTVNKTYMGNLPSKVNLNKIQLEDNFDHDQ